MIDIGINTAAQIWLVPLKFAFNVSKFKSIETGFGGFIKFVLMTF